MYYLSFKSFAWLYKVNIYTVDKCREKKKKNRRYLLKIFRYFGKHMHLLFILSLF